MAQNNRNNNTSNEYIDIYSSSKRTGAIPKKKISVRNIFIVFLSVVFLLAGSGLIYYYNILTSVNVVTHDPVSSEKISSDVSIAPVSDSDLANVSASEQYSHDNVSDALMNNSNVLNIMLFGEDNPGGAQFGRTDTMILLTVDNNSKQLKLTSFMRDLWVNIPNYGMERLNTAYALGGAPRAVAAIEANFGIQIDRYAIVNYESFVNIIDILGGLEIELTDEEIDYINWQTWKNGQADTRYEIQAQPGVVRLLGRQALWHARNRGENGICSGDDFERTRRQRTVLTTLLDQFKDASLTQVVSIVNQVGPYITTDLSYSEITVLVANALTYLKYDMVQFRLPEDGEYLPYTTSGGASVLVIEDWATARADLTEFVFTKQEKSSDYE